jgi:alpha-L-fucosidase 2
MLISTAFVAACGGDAKGASLAASSATSTAASPTAAQATTATPSISAGAWDGKRFAMDAAGVVSRSSVFLALPNTASSEAMPLGNGRLGAAVWSANGLTAQLNRADTLPNRLSPGQVNIPGLSQLTSAADYNGRLDLYNGEFRESGGGMTATTYVQPDTDALIIDVTGANPTQPQTATLQLWSPRTPTATVSGNTGVLSQSWIDGAKGDAKGGSGQPFGTFAAITALARDVSASITNPLTITVNFTPNADGTFRIVVGAPHYDGSQTISTLAASSMTDTSPAKHTQAWNAFWGRAGLIKLSSSDGTGEYMENLRNLYLYSDEAENKDTYPGSQAGVGNLFSAAQDYHNFDPPDYWHWNLRMQIATNLSAGLFELNAPYFNLYRNNLSNIEQWTTANMASRAGICVPETMRFNGNGMVLSAVAGGMVAGCSATASPFYNARTITTGAEVSHFIWKQYLATNDLNFLETNYPVMVASTRFMLAYQRLGTDKLLHTSPTNAHETQWDVADSTTDIAAINTMYADTLSAGKILQNVPGQTVDSSLTAAIAAALPQTPDYPRTQPSGTLTLLPPSADAAGTDVIADSYQPAAGNRNSENIGLEPVWPYDQIGDTSSLFALAKRTYASRPYKTTNDWSFDPIDAARLGISADVKSTLVKITTGYQKYPNGFASFGGPEFYVEQAGVVAAALAESLVQDYDGLIRIAPAIPAGWDYDGTVFVRGNTKVDVQVRNGVPMTVVIEPGSNTPLTVRNPWPGANVIASSAGFASPIQLSGTVLTLKPVGNSPILLQNAAASSLPVAPISGTQGTAAKHLGAVQIGL